MIDAAFLLTGGVLLDTAVWGKGSGTGTRFVAAGILLLCSGAIIWLGFILILLAMGINPGDEDAMFIIVPISIVTLGFKLWYVRSTWKRAMRRLDGD
jgi:hypothetical protein